MVSMGQLTPENRSPDHRRHSGGERIGVAWDLPEGVHVGPGIGDDRLYDPSTSA